MNRFIIVSGLIILVFLASLCEAGIPKMINYQGMLTDDSGDPITDTLDLEFRIYDSAADGNLKWSETQPQVPIIDGLFNVILGSINLIDTLSFSEQYWLEVQVGTTDTMPRIRFTSVAYAYRAEIADTATVAVSAPTGGGWTDDGTLVRLETSTDSVGIGTTSPVCKLHLASSTSGYGMLKIQNTNPGDNEASVGFVEGSDASYSDIWVIGVSAWYNTNDFVIGRNGAKFLITPDGDVGIGTISPEERLHVQDIDEGVIKVGTPTGNGKATIIFEEGGDDALALRYDGTENELRIDDETKDSTRMVIERSGNVGIGTADPETKLAVLGLTGTSSHNYVKVNTSTGAFYYSSSSKRYKEDVRPLEDDFHKIFQAEPKSFIDKASGQREIGYIAEEFDGMGLNNLVIYDKEGRPDGLKYELVSLYLLEVMKDQAEMMKELEADNEKLRRRIEALEAR
jgi:hypothetical protein